MTAVDLTFTGNTAVGTGGGVAVSGVEFFHAVAVVVLSQCSLTGNSATSGGAIVVGGDANVTIRGVSIVGACASACLVCVCFSASGSVYVFMQPDVMARRIAGLHARVPVL